MPKRYSDILTCGYCRNKAPMEVIGSVQDFQEEVFDNHPSVDSGEVYDVLKCPACSKVNIASYFWAEYMDPEDAQVEIIYPQQDTTPRGLPDSILKAYRAAESVRHIDVNAYAILLRRLLELVCHDRSAEGATLALMLKDLANKNEVPEKLVNVANGLKNFGNVGAHVGIGELTEKEIPMLRALCFAILEYLYSAPFLANQAEEQLTIIKTTAKSSKKNKSI
jgi:hypothetical protein